MRIIGGKHKGTKLYTLEGLNTRPTLDRVKESLFSILQFELPDAIVLDLFSGSGALGLEAISRGAKKAVLCDQSRDAIHIIEKNVEKTKAQAQIQFIQKDYVLALEMLKKQKEQFNLIFLDPPYDTNFAQIATQKIIQFDLLKENGIIIIETDRKNEVMQNINQLKTVEIYDERKYGRVTILLLRKSRV